MEGKYLESSAYDDGRLLETIRKVLPLYLNEQGRVRSQESPLGPFVTDTSVYRDDSGERAASDVVWAFVVSAGDRRRCAILVDPVWEQRASPLPFLGPKTILCADDAAGRPSGAGCGAGVA